MPVTTEACNLCAVYKADGHLPVVALDGLGDAMVLAQRFADSEGVFVGIATVSVLGYAAMQSVSWVRSVLLRWHPEAQAWHR